MEVLFHACDKITLLQNGRIEKIYRKEDFSELTRLKF